MKKIASFTIDHERLLRGIYVSRIDTTPSGDRITTFDIRMTEPNREAALSPQALHTIEHLAATYLRNDQKWADKIVYWGPMGCCTGSYLLMQGELTPDDILPLMRRMFEFISNFEGEIPGASARDCGNYTFNDLPSARDAARKYLTEVLDNISEENMKMHDRMQQIRPAMTFSSGGTSDHIAILIHYREQLPGIITFHLITTFYN